MSTYYYYVLVALFLVIVLFIRYLMQKRKNVPVELFAQGLRNENSGDYAAAVTTYKSALLEFKKKKHNNSDLENKIVEKLKVLHTIIEYERSFQSRK